MKAIFAAALLAFLAPAFAEQGMDHQHMEADKSAKTTAHKASGTVTRVDEAKKKVSIQHGAVPTLGWPAMTMTFTVKDPALLAKLTKDKKVDFEFVQQGKDYVVTKVN